MVTGLDIGYGFTKMVSLDVNEVKKTIFPSYVSRYIPNNGHGSFGCDYEVIKVNGKDYIVGSDMESSTRIDLASTDNYLAIIAYAVSRIESVRKTLILGLPPQAYEGGRIDSLTAKIREMDVKLASGRSLYIPPIIDYVPQGAGIFFSYLTGNGGEAQDSNVAVVDMGYQTMDVVTFSGGRYRGELAKSYPLGAKALYSKVRDAYVKKYAAYIPEDSDNIVEILLKGEAINHLGEKREIDTKSILNDFYVNKILDVLGKYVNFLEEHKIELDKIVLGGGGIAFLGNVSGAEIVPEPQFANARGFFEYGMKLQQ